MKKTTDELDIKIIDLLKKNGRMPNTEIAKRTNVCEATVRKRVKKLTDENLIRIVAVGNFARLVSGIVGNIKVKVDKRKIEHVIQELKKINELWYIAQVTGAADFDIEFSVNSQEQFGVLIKKIGDIDGVIDFETLIRLRMIKNEYDWETAGVEEGKKYAE